MEKKQMLLGLALLCIVASGAMYVIGGDSGNLTELRDYFWAPLPLGVILYLISTKA